MDGFSSLLEHLAQSAGVGQAAIFRRRSLELPGYFGPTKEIRCARGQAGRLKLPGYFRPTKEWDFLVVHERRLLAVVEAKSHVGPSFGNNFNNRTEEAMGSAADLWTAYREGAFESSPRPWLGYIFLLEDCQRSTKTVRVDVPHFKVFREFENTSYSQRYEIFCRKLVRERLYCEATFIMSTENDGVRGDFRQPADDLSIERFARSFMAHVGAFTS